METLVVMTPTGEFVNVPWGKKEVPVLGSEIEFKLPFVTPNFFSPRKMLALAASIVFFLLVIPFVSAYLFPSEQQVIAYVGIDINPSLELGLDKEGKVKEATGLNEEGKKLLEKIQFANLSVDKVIKLITQEAIKQQYLAVDEENKIILTVSTREEREGKRERKLEEKSEKKAEMLTKIQKELAPEIRKELDKQKIEAQVEILEISPKFYQNAKKAGVSPGKYAVILEAMQEGLDVSPEDVKFSSVVRTIKAAGGNPGEIISRTKKEEKRLLEIEKEIKKEMKKQKNKEKNEEKNEEKINGKQNFKEKVLEKKEQLKDGDKSTDKGYVKNKAMNKNKVKVMDKDKDKEKNKHKDKEQPKKIMKKKE